MKVISVARVKFRWPAKIFEFVNPENLPLKADDFVVVKTDRGLQKVGKVAIAPRLRAFRDEDKYLTPILRSASDRDRELEFVKDEFRDEVKRFFAHRIKSREIKSVRMIDCEKSNGGQRLIIYYSSEDKNFDSKTIAIEIAKNFNVRVDMRGVGVRDGARLAGGIGKCGLSLCCSTWIKDFSPVSVRHAKDQGISPEPEGITGQCGRLLCCLGYEHENYVEMGKNLPKPGKIIVTPDGDARVLKLDILKGDITSRLEDGSVKTFNTSEVKRKFSSQPQQGKKSQSGKQKSSNKKKNQLRIQKTLQAKLLRKKMKVDF